jgi:hypothetical protein
LFFLCCVVAVSAANLASAQQASVNPARAGVSIAWVAATNFEGGAQAVLRGGDEWRSAPFDVPTNHLTEPIAVPVRAISIEAGGREVGKVSLPEEGRTFVAILVPAAENRWRALVVRTDDGTFRPGDLFLYNGSPTMVGGKLGKQDFSLTSGSSRSVRPKPDIGKPYFDVNLYFREDEKTRILSTTRWPVDDRTRGYIFFFVDPKAQRLTYRAVDEYVPPPAAGGGKPG